MIDFSEATVPHEEIPVEVTLAILCDYANVSQEGKLNIMGVFQEINPPVLPFGLPVMYLVASYDAGPAEFGSDKNVSVVLLDSDGKEVLKLEQPMKVPQAPRPGSRAVVNHVIGLGGTRFDKAGDYAFSILIGGEEKRSVPLRVNDVPKGVSP